MSQSNYSKALSLNSDDEYHYSDLEDEDDDQHAGAADGGAADDDEFGEDEEYQYSEDENASVASESSNSGAAGGVTSPKAAARQNMSPVGGEGSMLKKKKINPAPTAAQSRNQQLEYRVIDEEELFREQHQLIREISQVLELPLSTAAVLLRHYSWNKEKLFEGYYMDPAKAKHDAGVEFAHVPPPVFAEGSEIDCLICCESYPPNEVFGMGCGHVYCLNCWKPYLSLKIAEGPLCVVTTCPAHGCKEVVNDEVFRKLTTDEDFRKYSRYLLRSFVDINKCVKWCPSPGCSKAISSEGGLSSVSCTCGCVFCLRCGEEAHSPATCEQLALWMEKCRNESETANWILANTKKCPRCSVRIEKNQGCNHMTCRGCNYEFCWICMEDWQKHGSGTGGYYKCNRYDGQQAQTDSDVARAKAELDRYLHYYQRYANHSEAGKFAQRMREGTEARMIALQSSHCDSSWIDVQFLNAATEQLIECRRVLKYTYVFGYYLPQGKEKNLFEYLQENLEKNTEHLTGLSEQPLEKMNRSEIINYTRVTERFLRNLLSGVEDGLTSNPPMV
ncbi:TPA: hypothetical protein N0F65_000444 [Lagenidium giganteum]|uniref:RBR-type E3 ubiquitin transferase n=1 Tax=Lagenidium giganteum TaxID=4803 RepID=A0AAV2YI08_9STRA|nr:TPA: hypothetical protein N0F65_000444 [Lagenidium giganteum]